ncbi:MAG: phosphoribosylanthranilate isomerase [Trueperaceae bacterium]
MRVKICGITRAADAVAAEAAGADAIGLMFVSESPRAISMAQGRELSEAVGPLMVRVGVFRDAPLEQVLESVEELRLGAVQLHGSEDVAYLRAIRRKVPVVRAVSFGPHLLRDELESQPADALLLDGLRPGSGRTFDWSSAAHLRGMPRLILAGGLHPGNVTAGIEALRPHAVDVSSGVEESPGIKDAKLMALFVSQAHVADIGRATLGAAGA